MFERFTYQARVVVVQAQEECRRLDHRRIGTEHLLLALLSPEAGTASVVLRESGLDRAKVTEAVERLVGQCRPGLSAADVAALETVGIDADAVLAKMAESLGKDALLPRQAELRRSALLHRMLPRALRRGPRAHAPFAPRAKKVLELSLREALALKHNWIGSEHILLGLLREGNGLGAQIIAGEGLDFDQLRAATTAALRDAA